LLHRCGLSAKDSPSVWRATRSDLEMTKKGWRGRRGVNCGRDVDSCGVRPPRNEVTSHVCYRFRQFCSASPEIHS
jgi:hypothetical protein